MKKAYIVLTISLIFEVVADYFFKIWSMNNRSWQIASGLVCYGLATLFFAFSIRDESLTKMVCWFTIFNCLAASAIGIYFGEPFTARIGAGLTLGAMAIWLLS